MQQGFHIIIEELLASYIDNRKVNIREKNGKSGEEIRILSGVPQGGILSPTLFILYTSDMPETPENIINVAYADDVTQIIKEPTKSKGRLALKTVREINRLNEYENKWKIKTNSNKFQLLSVSKSKPPLIRINNQNIQYVNEVKILGLSIKRTGIVNHIKHKLNQAKHRKGIMNRFRKLNKNIRTHLYKSIIRPVFEYPVVPTCIMSQTNLKKLQSFQNNNIRQIHKNNNNNRNQQNQQNNDELTIEELHRIYKVDPLNIRYHKRANNTWEKFKGIYPETARTSEEIDRNVNMNENDHAWWKRVAKYVNQQEPPPQY